MSKVIDENGNTANTGTQLKKKLWDTMKNDIMKGKTQKKKADIINDILNN